MFIAQNSATRFEKKTALLKCRNFDGKRQTRNCSLTFAVRRKNAMLKVSNLHPFLRKEFYPKFMPLTYATA